MVEESSAWTTSAPESVIEMKAGMFVIIVLCGSTLMAGNKETKWSYMESRSAEAMTACKNSLLSGAKDPESISFESIDWSPSNTRTKDELVVTGTGRGRNGYGALLRMEYVCVVKCKTTQICVVKGSKAWTR